MKNVCNNLIHSKIEFQSYVRSKISLYQMDIFWERVRSICPIQSDPGEIAFASRIDLNVKMPPKLFATVNLVLLYVSRKNQSL